MTESVLHILVTRSFLYKRVHKYMTKIIQPERRPANVIPQLVPERKQRYYAVTASRTKKHPRNSDPTGERSDKTDGFVTQINAVLFS